MDTAIISSSSRPVSDVSGPDLRARPVDLDALIRRFVACDIMVGVIGLGYVGLPLVSVLATKGFAVSGFDIDTEKVAKLNTGQSYIRHIPDSTIADLLAGGRFQATTDFTRLGDMDAILVCVPTPLTRQREPDLSHVVSTTEAIAHTLRRGQLVVLESTTYPGTTRDVMRPILERGGLVSGQDFFLAFSPEREDPGNPDFSTAHIPKVVGGDGVAALRLACALYEQVVKVVPVSSAETAEAVKLTENIFRAVNIALVNELKVIYAAMGIDIWDVIEAAKTKPFGYMPFYPGPGLGGHCIPVDPFYLTWKAREYDITPRFIELAGQINTAMPYYVIDRVTTALNDRFARGLKGTRILVLGLAYKKNIDDTRESPTMKLVELLEAGGAEVSYHDPHVPEIPILRMYPKLKGRRSVAFRPDILRGFDCALISTDHDVVDYAALVENCPLVVDTRNVCARRGLVGQNIVKA